MKGCIEVFSDSRVRYLLCARFVRVYNALSAGMHLDLRATPFRTVRKFFQKTCNIFKHNQQIDPGGVKTENNICASWIL